MGLSEQIASLPPELQEEVADFVGYLLQKRLKQQQAVVNKSLDAAQAFHGLGAELWKDIDPDRYIQELRADW